MIDPDPNVASRSIFHFLLLRNRGFSEISDLLAFLIQSPANFYHTWRRTDDTMNPRNIGTDPVDIRMLITINPEILMRIRHHILCLAEFVLSQYSCVVNVHKFV